MDTKTNCQLNIGAVRVDTPRNTGNKCQIVVAFDRQGKGNKIIVDGNELSEKTKDYAIGTSLRNYIDPRVFKAWTDEVGAEWEKLYTAALQKKLLICKIGIKISLTCKPVTVKKTTFLVQLEKFLALLISQLDRMIQEPIKANKNPSRPLSPSSVKGFQQDRTVQLFGTKDRRSFIVPRQRDNGTNSKSYLGTGRAGTVCQNPERDMERYQILTACLILFFVTKWDVL